MSNPKSDIEWKVYLAAKYPGSQIMLPSTLDLRGGRFNQSAKPLTERDWIEKRAKDIPGPGQYQTFKSMDGGPGRFSTAKPKTDVEWKIYFAKKHPSSHIMLPSTLDLRGGRFNQSAKPLTERDWVEKRAKELPGPGHYLHKEKPDVGGGKFNDSRPKSDVEWRIVRAPA